MFDQISSFNLPSILFCYRFLVHNLSLTESMDGEPDVIVLEGEDSDDEMALIPGTPDSPPPPSPDDPLIDVEEEEWEESDSEEEGPEAHGQEDQVAQTLLGLLESIPAEITQKILMKLNWRDCFHLGLACDGRGRVLDVLKTVVAAIDVGEIVLFDEDDFMPWQFFKRSLKCFPRIRKIRLEPCLLASSHLYQFLLTLIRRCKVIRALEFEKDLYDSSLFGHAVDPQELEAFLAAIKSLSLRELYFPAMGRDMIVPLLPNLLSCAVTWDSLKRDVETTRHFLSLRTLHLHCDGNFWPFFHPLISGRDLRLKELSLTSKTYIYFDEYPSRRFRGISTLRLDWHASLNFWSSILPLFEDLKYLYLDISKTLEEDTSQLSIRLPRHLLEYHVSGSTPPHAKIEGHVWWSLFANCLDHPTLQVVTQSYDLDQEHVPRALMPRVNQLGFTARFQSGLFRDLYFYVSKPAEWTQIVDLLRGMLVPDLNHLYLFLWLYNELEADQIQPAIPEIPTRIERLSINDNHFHYSAAFHVLSSFADVGQYSIHCDVDSRLFKECRAWASDQNRPAAWDLHLLWNRAAKYEQLFEFTQLVDLTMDVDGGAMIDLVELRRVVGQRLKSLQIVGALTEGPCVEPASLAEVLLFDQLTQFSVKNLAPDAFPTFLAAVEGLKPFPAWRPSLKQMGFFFGGTMDWFIRLENFDGAIKMRRSDMDFPE